MKYDYSKCNVHVNTDVFGKKQYQSDARLT